ncbi:MAG: hypothetical protein U0168_01230 [Nannocystaceae bacterium]
MAALADVKASFDVIATSWLGAPPDGEITVAHGPSCWSRRAFGLLDASTT